ncbi:MAG TPA: toll/interleukin-1 receptor domain-containing protein [Solirubrobacterales bacterium]|nr:toll/interleukin-1 receptor domain-containing protein [Solirubrobacterales bacterium]
MSRPTCFISYRREDPAHQDWVLDLARDLGANGIAVSIDAELAFGSDLTHYMERSISESDFVVIVCTPSYAKRADERFRGVGYETTIITREIFNIAPERKFIPVLRRGEHPLSLPAYLGNRYAVDFRADGEYESSLTQLVRHIWGEPLIPPLAVGDRPRFVEGFRARHAQRKKSPRRKRVKRPTAPVAAEPKAARQPIAAPTRPRQRRGTVSPEQLSCARQNHRLKVNDNQAIFGSDHRIVLATRYDWAKRIGHAGDPAEAAKLYAALAADFKRIHGSRYRGYLAACRQQAHWSGEAGDRPTAIRLYRELRNYYADLLGPNHRLTRHCQAALDHLGGRAPGYALAVA